jgi:hypothetical protein
MYFWQVRSGALQYCINYNSFCPSVFKSFAAISWSVLATSANSFAPALSTHFQTNWIADACIPLRHIEKLSYMWALNYVGSGLDALGRSNWVRVKSPFNTRLVTVSHLLGDSCECSKRICKLSHALSLRTWRRVWAYCARRNFISSPNPVVAKYK